MKTAILSFVVLGVCAAAASLPRIAQDPAYHRFADHRTIGGLPNAADVLSNLPFAVAGAVGLVTVIGSARRDAARAAWIVFFGATAGTMAGSIYYHLSPGNGRVVWDRLPMAMAFVSLLAAVIAERVHARAGHLLLAPLLLAAAGSVAFWYWTELAGRGDLRPYGCVQFGSLAILAAVLLLYREPRAETRFLVAGLAAYAVAKVCEAADARIFALTHVVSGHTLKHLAAAAGVGCLVAMLRARTAGASAWRERW